VSEATKDAACSIAARAAIGSSSAAIVDEANIDLTTTLHENATNTTHLERFKIHGENGLSQGKFFFMKG
jgi:hypothetical protein